MAEYANPQFYPPCSAKLPDGTVVKVERRAYGTTPEGERQYDVQVPMDMTFTYPEHSLSNKTVTKAEARHVLYFKGDTKNGDDGGGFVHKLLLTIEAADAGNRELLRKGFPGYVIAMREWHKHELVERLDEED